MEITHNLQRILSNDENKCSIYIEYCIMYVSNYTTKIHRIVAFILHAFTNILDIY